MSDTSQILSYKKPSAHSSSNTSSHPTSPSLSVSSSPQLPSSATSTRKVSNRRKALQDFYKIQQKQNEAAKDTDTVEENKLIKEPGEIDFSNPDELSKFMKSNPIEEILKLRNSITNRLNSHSSAKKSIIYDNYYELIKLSQILGDLSKPKPPFKASTLGGLGIFPEEPKEEQVDDANDYLDSVFNELSAFINKESIKFNSDFETTVKKIQQEFNDSDSSASIRNMIEKSEVINFPSSIDKAKLTDEINFILKGDPSKIENNKKRQTVDEIQQILKKLDIHSDELLILQLNDSKKKFI